VKKRYESEKDPKHDMLGAFIKKGLKQREAETETALQMFFPLAWILTIVTNFT
jgi:hypothetical protein